MSAGNNLLKGDYVKASWQYLAASRMEAYLRQEGKKLELVNRAIALAFAAPVSPEAHRVVCALCLSETARRSHMFPLVGKLYRADILGSEEVRGVEAFLPESLKSKDQEGVSRVSQATFSRNMIPIINSFSAIRLRTLQQLIGLPDLQELLVLLEKTYQEGEISIDQLTETVHLKPTLQPQEFVKDFLSQVDLLLQE